MIFGLHHSFLSFRGGKFSPRLLIAADEEEKIKTVSFKNTTKAGWPVKYLVNDLKLLVKKLAYLSYLLRDQSAKEKKKRYFYLAFLAAINTEKAKGIISQQATRVLIHGVPRQRDSSFSDHVIFFISGLLDFVFPSSFLSIFLKTIRFLTIQYGFFLAIIVAKFSREKRQSKIAAFVENTQNAGNN